MRSVSIPFRIDGYGKVASSTTPERVYADRVKSVIGTPVGQRVMRPDFGSNVIGNLMNAPIPGLLETAIRGAVAQWLPDVSVTDVIVSYDAEQDGEIAVEVVYSIPNSAVDGRSYAVRIV